MSDVYHSSHEHIAIRDRKIEEINTHLSSIDEALAAPKADLVNGKVPSTQLPSYVNNVFESASLANFPKAGESGKIYITQDTNLIYRWSGNKYVEISQGLALGEAEWTAYAGNKGKENAEAIATLTSALSDHLDDESNPHKVTANDVGAYTTSEIDNKLSSKLDKVTTLDEIGAKYTMKDLKNKLNDIIKILKGGAE